MLRSRLIAGTILAAVMGALIFGDDYLAPYFPCLLACVLAVALLATHELLNLLPAATRPPFPVVAVAVAAVLASNWLVPLFGLKEPTRLILASFALAVIGFTLFEMARYSVPGLAVMRICSAVFVVAYLGVLASFFVQLRWSTHPPAWLALLLTVFVPKCCDIGAYFTGRLLGRTKFAPILSPKKTWEGIAGGVVTAIGASVALSYAGPAFEYGLLEAMGFGLVVGLAGVYGDLAESMLKRDAGAKDASKSVPGFGGVLDVIDSVLFAGPVAYLWWNH